MNIIKSNDYIRDLGITMSGDCSFNEHINMRTKQCRQLTGWNQKYNSDKLEMVQRRAARFVKGRYGMYESVTQMLEELTWVPLSKRRENARLILFYKIINNLAMVPHSCLEKADGRTQKKHNLKFRHIGYNVDPYGQSFFPRCISAWNGLAQEIAEANTLDLFKSKLAH